MQFNLLVLHNPSTGKFMGIHKNSFYFIFRSTLVDRSVLHISLYEKESKIDFL